MRRKTKRRLKKWATRLVYVWALGLLLYANVIRLNNNKYSNYEKAVEYGRVRETKEVIAPIITAIFYQGDEVKKKNVSTYLDHSDNYKSKNVKMVVVPKVLTENSYPVVAKLYAEIKQHNDIKKILLVSEAKDETDSHKQMLQDVMKVADLNGKVLNESDVSTESDIEKYLKSDGNLVVMLSDLSNGWEDFLAGEAVWLAQKYAYKAHVFDAVDTQIAKAVDKDYATLFSFPQPEEEPVLNKQQRNLRLYVNQYEDLLLQYFKRNLSMQREKEAVWPAKSVMTYRLYDRGAVYIRFFGENGRELMSRAKVGKNTGIIAAVIELARKAARKIKQPVKSFKIYLFTDFEALDWDGGADLVNYLETDDGVYIQYKNKNALMVADERPQKAEDWMWFLRNRARVPRDANVDDIKLYRFKTVEIEDEN